MKPADVIKNYIVNVNANAIYYSTTKVLKISRA